MNRFSKIVSTGAAALALAVALTASGGAEARGWGGRGWGIGAGILGGAIIGGAIVAASRPGYAYGPTYYSGPSYGPSCYTVRRINYYGEPVYRRVCE